MIEAVPLTTVHTPEPINGTVAAIVNVEVLHWVISAPALEVGKALFVMMTSSVAAVQVPFDTVHLNVAVVPATKPVTVVVALVEVVIEAVPLTTVHTPEPINGAVAAIVKVDVLQSVWSMPALAEAAAVLVKTTSSVDVQPL